MVSLSLWEQKDDQRLVCINWNRVLWSESQQQVSADPEACSTAGLCCRSPDGASEG